MQAVQGGLLGGHKSSPVRHKYMLYSTDFSSPLIMKICRPRPQLVFTFDNRFSSPGCAAQQSVRYIIFRLQASYLSATSHTGRKSCRVKSLYMKRFWYIQYMNIPVFCCCGMLHLPSVRSTVYNFSQHVNVATRTASSNAPFICSRRLIGLGKN